MGGLPNTRLKLARSNQRGPVILLAHSAQGTQRRLLSVRQAARPADVEPLIGSLGSQGRQVLVTEHVPERDRAIFPATGDCLAIGADAHGPGPRLVRWHRRQLHALLWVPPAYRAIRAGTQQQIAFSRPLDAYDRPSVAF